MKKFFLILTIIILIPSVSIACTISSSDALNGERCIDVGGYKLFTKIYGQSEPTVIFESGSGDDSTVWDSVAPLVAKFAHVIVYDRAGLGKSDPKPGNNPITSQDSVNSLKILLKNSGIKPPYILVGHSRGGLNMQLFAEENPKDVSGVVLVDSVSRNQTVHHDTAPINSNYYREAITFDVSRMQVKKADVFPAIPLIILTATNHHTPQDQENLWKKWQYEMKQLSPKSIQIFAWDSRHYIQKQQPQLVVDAVYTVIQMAGDRN